MEEEIEYWKDIEEYEGLYQVSTYGRIKSFKRIKEGYIMKPTKDKKGYIITRLANKTFAVHRLVGIVFIPNPYNKTQINHKDNDRSNNLVSNLEWATALQNTEHMIKQGRNSKGESHPISKLTQKEVDEIRKSNLTQKELAIKYNISKATISLIINNKIWK